MTPPLRHLLGCRCLYQQLWSGRPLWPGHCLWPSRNLWSGRCLWPCRCALPGCHSWPSRRLLPGLHLPSRPLPGPGLELLGPIQHESGGAARQPPWSYASQGPWTSQEIAGHPVWWQTSHSSYRNSLVVSRGDWAETCGLETPVMKMMRGIDDRPKNDDDGERKSPTGGWHALETLSMRAGTTRGTWPGPLALSPVAAVAVTAWRLMSRRLVTFFLAVSSLTFRRPGPAVVRPMGAGPSHRRDAGSHGPGLRGTRGCFRPLGLGRIFGLGTLGRKSVSWCV